MKIGFLTYGCKVNQYETERIKQAVLQESNTEVSVGSITPDIYIINTCTVTGKIDKEIERKIKQIKSRENAKVILTGCLVARDYDKELNKFVDFVIPNDKKYDLSVYPKELIGDSDKSTVNNVLENFSDKNKAFVKIEDGCNNYCTYCEIPYVRGDKISSRSREEIKKEVSNLVKNGYNEIILTGINLGLYGAEIGLKQGLLSVLKELVVIEGLGRLRLSSIGPVELTNETIDFIADNKNKICPHFHMSAQSGSDDILKLMKRKYSVSDFEEKVEYILSKMPEAAITTDIISGFPGETQKHHEETRSFISRVKFSRIHVFPYSDRPDTVATKMKDKVQDEEKKKRMKELLTIAAAKQMAFAQENIGEIRTVLVESEEKEGYYAGYTENYIRVKVKNAKEIVNKLTPVKITEVKDSGIFGDVVK